jgi:hypothetical protein
VEWAGLEIVGGPKREASNDWNRVLCASSDDYLKEEVVSTYGNVQPHHRNLSKEKHVRGTRDLAVEDKERRSQRR